MGMFSEDVIFWEKGRRLSYDFLVEYCPQLPKDPWQPEESSSERVMLGENVAYEILTERLIHPEDGSIHMRTKTEIWKQLGGDGKITPRNIGPHRAGIGRAAQRDRRCKERENWEVRGRLKKKKK